ncbi:lysosomal phospholipase A and acyltransferase-like isoform X2 [Periplaneta americana]|uniref:lysosomal phospholipase A and acyltransferase-like isoform X2 n=1 Tax=Periplaneta americana TaxID=6978 RepID=UPI0037E8AF8D
MSAIVLFRVFYSSGSNYCCCCFHRAQVPGDAGDQIEAQLNKKRVIHPECPKTTKDFITLWLNVRDLITSLDCWADNVKLHYCNVTRKTYNSEGVTTRIPGFGNTNSLEWLDPKFKELGQYFAFVVSHLVELGYERGVSLRGAPYDFRKAPNEQGGYFVQLKNLIEETYRINGNKPVALLAHSMGGSMALHLLHGQSKQWKEKYIHSLISLSGVWGGAVKAMKAIATGENFGISALNETLLREIERSLPSTVWLMPSSSFWKPDEILIQTQKKNFTVNNFQQFFDDIGYPTGWEMRKDIEKYSDHTIPPNVEVHCLHGIGLKTVDRLNYGKYNPFPDEEPSIVYGDGDGSVNKRSLEGCLKWRGQQKEKVHYLTFNKTSHFSVITDDRIITYLKKVLINM